jgi:hypothetical protein
MVRFVASGTSGNASFGAAQILRPRQFIAAVINHVVTGKSWRHKRAQFRDLHLHRDHRKNQERLQ